jgi:hypothetical protein
MGCGCGKRKGNVERGERAINNTTSSNGSKLFSVMGNYKYLTTQQIAARLEVYKRMYCKSCNTRYDCTYATYEVCTARPQS